MNAMSRVQVGGALAALAVAAALAGASAASTVPTSVVFAVHGKVVGWASAPAAYVAVYVEGRGSGWCGLDGASWWVGLVDTSSETARLAATHRLGDAMCGNSLSWVRAGRFSDGRHTDVAFQLWATPSLGATTYVYRVAGTRLVRLGAFAGDRVTLGRGTMSVGFENRGRSPKGDLRETYRFEGGGFRLVSRS
jgi:hypothetical protein